MQEWSLWRPLYSIKMNTIQVAASHPGICVRKKYQPHHFLSTPHGLSMNANPLSKTFLIPRAKSSSGLQCVPVLKSRKPLHVCLAGGKGMMDNSEVWCTLIWVILCVLPASFAILHMLNFPLDSLWENMLKFIPSRICAGSCRNNLDATKLYL